MTTMISKSLAVFVTIASVAFMAVIIANVSAGGPNWTAKSKELIGLGIAIATNCQYCVYMHSKMLELLGVSDAELAEVRQIADHDLQCSDGLNARGQDLTEFQADVDRVVAFVSERMQQ